MPAKCQPATAKLDYACGQPMNLVAQIANADEVIGDDAYRVWVQALECAELSAGVGGKG